MKNVLTIAALSLLVAACSTADARYDNGYQSGDRVFTSSQTK